MIQSKISRVALPTLVLLAATTVRAEASDRPESLWRGLHVLSYSSDKDLELLGSQIPHLAEMGVNVLVLEVNYAFTYQSHPELRAGNNTITRDGAGKLAAVCKQHHVRLIPQFQSLGHQSWRGNTLPLLTVYPQFDLTPGAFPGNKNMYCREWDPLNPEVNKIVFAIMDELIDAFHADALHVGMDEVFLIGADVSPSTKDKDAAKVFAKAVNDLHEHLVKERHVEMLMWADRLIDARKYQKHAWEASMVGTASAVDMIPKDIILCPWHYLKQDVYPSIPMFLDKGFRVLPAGWGANPRRPDPAASKALIEYSLLFDTPKMLGHLFTTWSGQYRGRLAEFPPLVQGLRILKTAGTPTP
jgi:hypothetical protein